MALKSKFRRRIVEAEYSLAQQSTGLTHTVAKTNVKQYSVLYTQNTTTSRYVTVAISLPRGEDLTMIPKSNSSRKRNKLHHLDRDNSKSMDVKIGLRH
jgi:hypothetical protein